MACYVNTRAKITGIKGKQEKQSLDPHLLFISLSLSLSLYLILLNFL